MIVKLKSSAPEFPDLSKEQLYFVIGIEADDFRIISDAGKPYLYPPGLFFIVTSTEPKDWITDFGEDGERYSYPLHLNNPDFFEDVFDRKPEQTPIFWHTTRIQLSSATLVQGRVNGREKARQPF